MPLPAHDDPDLETLEIILQRIALVAPILLFSIIAHEIAHGYAALRQGDPTAQQLGRLTWNPIRHLDPFLSVILPLVMLWGGGGVLAGAKPVPVDPRNYRNLRRGDIIVSLAGVATNLVIAIACALLILPLGWIGGAAPGIVGSLGILQAMMVIGVLINAILIIFNLLPIPPLDGSHVVKYLLPPRWALQYVRIGSRVGFLLLIGLVLFAPGALSVLLMPAFVATGVVLAAMRGAVLPDTLVWLQLLNA